MSPLRSGEGTVFPASFAQRRLWFLDQLEPGGVGYLLVSALLLEGELRPEALRDALAAVVARHDSLRTGFDVVDEEPVQVVADQVEVPLDAVDLSALPAAESQARLLSLVEEESRRPFDLREPPLLRARLVRLEPRSHVLVLTLHHIVSDGWSMGVLARDLGEEYGARVRGEAASLPELPVQYGDFAHWQREWLRGEELERQLSYWRERLGGELGRLSLPLDRPRPSVQGYRGEAHGFSFGREVSEAIRGLGQREGATLFMVLLAAWKALLLRYTGQADVVVGSPIANRNRAETEGLIGFFVNSLVLRTDLGGDPSFRELVGRVREVTLGAYDHQDLPFERLVEELRPDRLLSQNPLFQVTFALQNAPRGALELPGLRVLPLPLAAATTRFDLELHVGESPDGLLGAFVSSAHLFEPATIARLAEHYQRLLESAVAQPDRALSRLSLLGPEETDAIVRGFNQTAADYPRDATVHELFQAQALRTPDAVAVQYGDDRATYAELNRRANRLAHRLRALGVGPEVLVGVCLERSTELVVTLLAVLKAGGAYLPLDPTYPAERLAFMVADAQAPVVVTEASLRGVVPEGPAVVLLPEDEAEAPSGGSDEHPGSGTRADGLAYVIYTSGSTGRPKGVAVGHRAIVRLVRGSDYVRLGPDDRVAQASNASFDAATFEIWGALLNGACLVGIERETLLSPRGLAEALGRHGITTLFLTTALFNQMAAQAPGAFRTLRSVLFGGEAVDPRFVRDVLGQGAPARLLHVYGPTENTTFSSWHHVRDVVPEAVTVPIGRPIANSRLHVLDPSLDPVPVGVAGEVYVGGDGLARCYLGRPELTAARFVPDPFGEPGSRLYRTGDLGRYRPDGDVEFLGRLDDQVKLRGFRVELGEIESVLAQQPGVEEAVVLLRPGDDDKRLVAYVTPRDGASPSARELRTALSGRLPEYMVPSAFVVIDAIPLNPNGKVDRQALLAREVTAAEGEDGPARTPIEEGMAEIWARTLGRPRVGRDESFFELGGHSLLATRVMSQVRETFQAELPLRALFEAPTVAGLSRAVEEARLGGARTVLPLVRLARDVERPLSFAQRRLWFLDQLGAGAAYNVPLTLRLRGSLDPEALALSLRAIAARHEALRTTFPAVDAEPVPRVAPAADVPLVLTDLRGRPEAEREAEARRLALEEARTPFDLARGPLVRAALLQLSDDDRVLCLTLHHIVSDGWSMGVLARDLGEEYGARVRGEAAALPELPVQYGDFAHWQREWLRGEELERQLSYWRERLGGELGRLSLPLDRPRPSVQGYRGAAHAFSFGREVSEAIRALGQREGATLFMVLLAAWKALLLRYTGQADVVVGSPIANRNRAETEGLVGFFVNSLVLRTDLGGDPSFRELVGRVREVTLGAYDHQDLPFERLVEELQPDRLLSQNPLFQVAFAVQNAAFAPLDLPHLRVEPFPREVASVRFDLEVHVWEAGGEIAASLFYDVDLFDAATVAALGAQFVTLAAAAVLRPETRLSELPLLGAGERARVLALSAGPPARRPAGLVPVLVEEQAARAPDAVAVRDPAGVLTFGALDRRANRLARRLRALGVGPETVVGVHCDRSREMVIALLAVLKSGGAYLPLDPAHPRERVAFMLEDARVRALVAPRRLRQALPELKVPVVDVDGDLSAESDDPLAGAVSPGDLAYVIYTSGSTGRPKGVELQHGGLANLVAWHLRAYEPGPEDRATLVASPAFDASVWEVWPYLAAGAALHVPDEETRLHPGRLLSWLAAERITHSFLPTPLAEAVLREPEAASLSLRVLLTGGDRLHGVGRPGLPFRLVNHYGPTETTVVATWGEVDAASPLDPPIGAPIDGTSAHVLDARLAPVPVGVPGELYVGGRGVGRGYRGRPALTAERFVPDPFATAEGARLYRTGDVVRRRATGELEFLGRRDAQVKVRGHRIELGEVEAALLRHPAVQEAAAAVREDEPGQPKLVAWVVPRAGGASGAEDERGHVAQWQMLYEETYGQAPADLDPTFNVTGWNSSYTGRPIPAEEMREWVDSTVDRIRSRRPRRVLEIGCGTGLLLSRLAPSCERYLGTDFSETALRHVEERILASRSWPHVSVERRMADDFDGFEPGSFDAVVLNSVVQYFPGVDYLRRVLDGALRTVAEDGFVFVGDVRNQRLLEAYHASVQLRQAPATLGVERLLQQVLQHADQEEELVVDPGLFLALAKERPGVGQVEIEPKWGRFRNELTAYRYDAVLHRGGRARQTAADWIEWDGLSLEGLERLLRETGPPAVGLRGVANGRVALEVEVLRRLRDGATGSVGDLRVALGEGPGGPTPEDVRRLAGSLGYEARVSWARPLEAGRYDVLLVREGTGARAAFPEEAAPPAPWRERANDPLRKRAAADLGPRLRAALLDELPEAMVPAAFVVLPRLPLTPNGKVDRKALPGPDDRPAGSPAARVDPRSPVEEAIAAVWAEVLGRESVSVHDDFFALGGHSLLATQVVSRLRETLRVELPLRALFEDPTVAGLAGRVARDQGGPSTDPGSIRPAPRSGSLPLSFAQERLWFLEQLYPGTAAYNMPFAVRIRGPLDAGALERSLADLARRHESLRTTFAAVDGRPVQVVSDRAPVAIEAADLRTVEAAGRERELARRMADVAGRPFDLSRGPLLRAALLRLLDDEHAFLLVMHHAVSDGWSMGVLLRELSELYAAAAAGRPAALPELPAQYADFACWQREWLQGAAVETQLAYWRERLRGLPSLDLPADRPRPKVASFRGAAHRFRLPDAVAGRVKALGRREGVTPFMVLLAAVQALLSRLSGQTDVVVGTPIAGRNRREIEGLVGFFVNSLVLRTDLGGAPSFRTLLARVRETALGAYAHQDVPFERLVDALRPEREMGRNPLYQVSVSLQNAPAETLRLGEARVEPVGLEIRATRFDLELNFAESPAGLWGVITYGTDLFDAATVERLAGQLETLLASALSDPERRVDELELLTPVERRALAAANATRRDYPKDVCLHELVEAQVERTPEAPAVVFEGEALTYLELNARANRLAHHLRGLGVGPEVRVGIAMERSLELVVGLLAILKSGGAYVPLDPGYPAGRLAFMAEDAGASVLLTQDRLAGALPPHEGAVVRVDADVHLFAGASSANPRSGALPDNLAYVIYTSGSTGRPKGAMNAHAGVVNRLLWTQQEYGLTPGDRVLQKTPFSFDVSVWELFWPLLAGARLVVARPGGHQNAAYLARLIEEQGITTAHFVPSMLRAFLDDPAVGRLRGLRRVLCSGEALPPDLVERFFARQDAELHNLYGPTEAAVDVTRWACRPTDAGRTVPIGRPVANTRAHVLDAFRRPLPIGVPGELYLGGVQVGRGYLGRPDWTAERFVPDPTGEEPGGRLYRTGDLARRRADGALEFLGRIDHQVKVRGFRIELGEIEAALLEHAGLREAVVVARHDDADTRLVAYVAPNGEAPSLPELRLFLKERLPEHMVPAAFVVLPALPLSPNGKVDRGALPEPGGARPDLGRAPVAPRTPAEEALARIWGDVLRLDAVGVHDNFFELGGDSILSIRVVARANEAGLALTPMQVFQHQTVAELAAVAGGAREVAAEQGPVTGPVVATPIQAWFLEQGLPDAHHFNQSLLLELGEPVDPTLLRRALARLAGHHDVLRLRLRREGSGWRQEIAAEAAFPLDEVDLSGAAAPGALAEASRAVQKGLDLERGPVARAALVHLGASRGSRLLLAIHHLAVDGVSWGILLEDLQAAYGQLRRGEPVRLPAKTTSFQAWSERLSSYAQSAAVRAELPFWTGETRPGVPGLPVDRPEGGNTVGQSATFVVSLGAEDTRRLVHEAPSALRAEMNDLLLGALLAAAARWTGQGSLLVDLEGHGREELFPDLSVVRTVGWFTSLYPVRLTLDRGARPVEAVRRVREKLRTVPRRGVGYGLLRHLCADERTREKLRSGARADVLFNYLGRLDAAVESGPLFRLAAEGPGPLRAASQPRSHALEVAAAVVGGVFRASFIYGAERHREASVGTLASGFVDALRELVRERPARPGAGVRGEASPAEVHEAVQEVEFE